MKVGKPIYFSPNFHHRMYVDKETKSVKIEYTLNPGGINNVAEIHLKKQVMFAKTKDEPMIYFHSNDKIVFLTTQGIEKLFLMEMPQQSSGFRRKRYNLREIANISYSEKEMIRRILFDQYHYKKELNSQINHLNMLQIRTNIIKRNLILNEYTIDRVEEPKTKLKASYQDKNIGDFSYFIVDSFRRQLNFSYLSWKIIDQVRAKKFKL